MYHKNEKKKIKEKEEEMIDNANVKMQLTEKLNF